MDPSEAAAAPPPSSSLSSTTEELFRIWQGNCLGLANKSSSSSSKVGNNKLRPRVAAVRDESRQFFASLVQGTTVQLHEQGVQLTTKASHPEALALLIRSLEPCFRAGDQPNCIPRWAALSCLVGAVEGCCSCGGGGDVGQPEMPVSLVKLLSTFLLQHAGPIELSSSSSDPADEDAAGAAAAAIEDYDEQIRDTALTGLTALVQCRAASTAVESSTPPSLMVQEEMIQLRLSIAKNGVERRCTDPDTTSGNAMMDTDEEDEGHLTNYHYGLSLLPRSRRSLCFDLIRAAVDAVRTTDLPHLDQVQLSTKTLSAMAEFAKFTVSCLHGESDPRCLLQLLHLFGALLEAFRPLGTNRFPVSELFDAVAPYYPIQFNPPPNDTHGITKEDLRQALIRILSCTRYDNTTEPDDTMATLTTGIVLESLVPPPEDGPVTVREQVEALEDLQAFLFANHDDAGDSFTVTNCDVLDATELEKISKALLVVHETASVAVSRGVDDGGTPSNRDLADLCRTVVAQVALATERRRQRSSTSSSSPDAAAAAWRAFVERPVHQLSARLDSSDSGRIAIAYLACLASSGGPQTLQLCLKAGLEPLLKILVDKKGAADEELCTTAVYGIGAFASSCRVAMENAAKDGIRMHPHPLQPYSAKAVEQICEILNPSTMTDSCESESSVASPLGVAAIRALESFLLVTPRSWGAEDLSGKLSDLFRSIASQLVVSSGSSDDNRATREEFLSASAHTLGSMLGRIMDSAVEVSDEEQSAETSLLIESEQIRESLLDDVLLTLFSSAKIHSKNPADTRHDRKALAMACTYSLHSASRILQPLVEALHKAMLDGHEETATATAETLACLFDQRLAARAFQDLSSPTPTVFDIISALRGDFPETSDRMEADFGMSMLKLPPSVDREAVDNTIEKALRIVGFLRIAYEAGVTTHHFAELTKAVDNVLPPLSASDTVGLSTLLPILSAAMENSRPESSAGAAGETLLASLATMAADLTEFAMDPQNYPAARSHAARCVHAFISRYASRSTDECPARKLAEDKVLPVLKSRVAKGKLSDAKEDAVEATSEVLSILALLGSAAARRGGPHSSKTADDIVLFLVNLACTKVADLPFLSSADQIDLSVFDHAASRESTRLSMNCASQFGSILSTDFGNVLWRQRLTHISVRRIFECITKTASNGSTTVSLGALAAVCHVVCSSSLQHIAPKNHEAIAGVIVAGLRPSSLQAAMSADIVTVKLLLAALVKLLCVAPELFQNSIFSVVTGTMHAYAIASDKGSDSETACKLLALQALASAAQVTNTPKTLHALKSAVVSILGPAMNHPSGLMRHAAVEVRNVWALLE